eukprot:2822750-Amphidinium_carterae.1
MSRRNCSERVLVACSGPLRIALLTLTLVESFRGTQSSSFWPLTLAAMPPKKKQKVATKSSPSAPAKTQSSETVVDAAKAESGEIRKPRCAPKSVKSMVRHALTDSRLRECSPETIDGRTYEGKTLRERLEEAKEKEFNDPKS